MQGEQTDTRDFNDRTWRFANTNGWFAWDFKVLATRAQELRVEFGGGRGGSPLVVMVDETKLSDEPSDPPAAERGPRTRIYSLPADLVKGKEKITVRFQAPANVRGGSVASVRVLKPAE
jgi:hypothetical protein